MESEKKRAKKARKARQLAVVLLAVAEELLVEVLVPLALLTDLESKMQVCKNNPGHNLRECIDISRRNSKN